MSGLPSGWVEAPIGELCGLKNGRAFKPTDWTTSGVPIVRIQNLNNSEAKFNFYAGEVEDRFRLRGGELLFAWSGTPGTSFGAHVWNGGDAVLNQHIFRVDFDASKIDKRFFRFAINQKLDELIGIAHGGAGLQHVTKGKFEGTEIWLPPLPEQTRIADKLDALLARVDAARERLDRVPALLKRFRQSVLAAATSGELTEDWRGGEAVEWPKTKLGTIVDCQSGVGFPPALQGQDAGDYPFAKVSDISKAVLEAGGMVSTANNWIGAEDAKALRAKIIPAGATIFAKIGEGLKLNRRAIVQVPLLIDNNCMALLPREGCVDPKYLYLFMRTVDLGEFAIATAVPSIRRSDIESIELALPPMDEQAEIIRRVEALFALADKVQAQYDTARARVDKLTPALLAKAFRGELVPQDPNDEPASVLLERLRTSKASEATPAKRGRKPSTDAAKTRTAR